MSLEKTMKENSCLGPPMSNCQRRGLVWGLAIMGLLNEALALGSYIGFGAAFDAWTDPMNILDTAGFAVVGAGLMTGSFFINKYSSRPDDRRAEISPESPLINNIP